MSDQTRSAEDVAREVHEYADPVRAAAVIERDRAEVRADERAKVLGEFTEERATSWETGEVDYHRLVGPWVFDGEATAGDQP